MEQEMTNEERSRTLPEQLRLLYSSCVSEIGSYKEQQWKTTNYALLVYAAIVSIAKTTDTLSNVEWLVLFVATVAVLLFGVIIINMLANSIQARRTRLTEVRKHFADEFMIAWSGGKPLNAIVDDPNEKSRLDWFFYSVLGLGCAATVWLLARQLLCAS
jgi:hypothetical protein